MMLMMFFDCLFNSLSQCYCLAFALLASQSSKSNPKKKVGIATRELQRPSTQKSKGQKPSDKFKNERLLLELSPPFTLFHWTSHLAKSTCSSPSSARAFRRCCHWGSQFALTNCTRPPARHLWLDRAKGEPVKTFRVL